MANVPVACACAHHNLAENYHSAGEDQPARRHWQLRDSG